MKISQKLTLTVLALLLAQWVFAQPTCGFDLVHRRKMKEDPTYRQNVRTDEARIREYLIRHPQLMQPPRAVTIDKTGPSPSPLTALYTIPVVVHVVHTGGAIGTIYNPTDAQITGAINYLNSVYNGSIAGTEGAGDLQVQFALAKRDPNCNPTNGINRVDGSGVSGYVSGGVQASQSVVGTADINVKNLIRWDPTQYYNVWVVDKIDGADGTGPGSFIAGFAYFPGSPSNEDGIIMLATQMISGQKTLPHEIGHAFNLYHPFQSNDASGLSCDPNTDCSVDGDMVCDTDPITIPSNFQCRTGTNPCTGTPYNDSTEKNYMNYTFCYDLFTPGQKARMLAAAAGPFRLSLSTSQGATAPNAGSSPCTPKIDFELSGDQVTEATAASSGCRSYTDYTYNLVIGNSPSVAATATISQSSGTATRGVDYDLTTNGSFAAPSSVVNFPSGSAAPQPFKLRVYDDASVNGTRNFTLGYSVNSGGGNAVAGDGRNAFTMIVNDNDAPPTAGSSTGTVTLGTASFGFTQAPFDASQASARMQFQYTASELTAAGVPAGSISGIALEVNSKHSTRAFSNLTIKLGTSTTPFLINGGSVTEGSNMTVVKTLSSYSTVSGWNSWVFDSPFTWDGTSNLVVEFCYNNGSTAADAGDQMIYYGDGGSAGQDNAFFQNGVDCSTPFSAPTYFPSSAKPSIKLSYGTAATAVQTLLGSSSQQYLGPNSDVYFYDQVNSQLMARIQNLSAFDYGCTTVSIDRQGTSATPFWNSNSTNYLMDKTFHVLPTTNNASGSYNITLYYTPAEINGWQTATGQSLSNIQLVKVAGQILSVTPAAPAGGGAFVTGTPAISSLGSNTGLTFNFTTGFSGFGAGVPGSATLPIGLLNFDGHLSGNNVVLDWSTAMEAGNKGFGIERSYDGKDFGSIAFIPGAVNSSTIRHYSFTDPSPALATNYYRLKQTDLDGHSITTRTIEVTDPVASARPYLLLSNPFANSLDILFTQAPAGKVNVRLLDATGKLLLRQVGTAGPGRMHIDLAGRSIAAGIYLLEVEINGQVHIEKLVKE
ncbi:MAG: M43 family zinc metalloprotease [Bacteroidota bacterium]|nr:M43 family zinc metalloprotease [Bacteroidota bacterium]